MSISLRQRQQGLQASPAAPFVVIFGGVRSPEQPTVVAEKDRFFCIRDPLRTGRGEKIGAVKHGIWEICPITPAKRHAGGVSRGEGVFWV